MLVLLCWFSWVGSLGLVGPHHGNFAVSSFVASTLVCNRDCNDRNRDRDFVEIAVPSGTGLSDTFLLLELCSSSFLLFVPPGSCFVQVHLWPNFDRFLHMSCVVELPH